MASSKGELYLFLEVFDHQGKNTTTCDPWTARDFMKEIGKSSVQCQHCLSGIVNGLTGSGSLIVLDDNLFSDCNHITYLPRVTSAEFRSNSAEEKYVAPIKIVNNLRNIFLHFLQTQLMRLSKPEPKPFLQLDLHFSGNVATKRLGDLWQPHHHLHQQDHRATQTEVPKLHGR